MLILGRGSKKPHYHADNDNNHYAKSNGDTNWWESHHPENYTQDADNRDDDKSFNDDNDANDDDDANDDNEANDDNKANDDDDDNCDSRVIRWSPGQRRL